jgi:response regulator RpfG family c-di-GMP phosphodiesterase
MAFHCNARGLFRAGCSRWFHNHFTVQETGQLPVRIIFSLATLAEGRDPGTGEHLERTRQYVNLLARQLRKKKEYRKIITTDYLDALYAAAPLHDIGKVGIPDAILLKASGLTDKEYGQ